MKLLKGLLIVALLVAFTIPVYAETQSIKLSGDLTFRGISRKNYDFNKWNASDNLGANTGVIPSSRDLNACNAGYLMTTAEVQLDADLTDNVSATIRVVNQRDWNVRLLHSISTGEYLFPSDTDNTASNDEFKIDIDLAYVTLKEFFFSPLTVKIGRQDIWFGKGFIVGANGWQDPQHQLSGDEWSVLNAFDAIRATWDFEPWTLDAIFAKITENEPASDDDENLWGLNLGCDMAEYWNSEAELYYFLKDDRGVPNYNIQYGDNNTNTINCLGGRGSFEPHEEITLFGEVAVEFGKYTASVNQQERRNRSAWAVDVGSECRLWEEQFAWKPKFGLEYIFYSGQDVNDDHEGAAYHGWDRMFRGKVDSAIHEWYNVLYTYGTPTANDRGDTNLHQFIVSGSLQPMDNLMVDARWVGSRLHENATAGVGNKDVGNELDVQLNYEYTEDVTFGLLGAWFWAGDYYTVPEHYSASNVPGGSESKAKNVASELVASCKVSF